jgi:NAD(P)-dependent dehydrogenase (short-subunit alcohol dehydrogenase family)
MGSYPEPMPTPEPPSDAGSAAHHTFRPDLFTGRQVLVTGGTSGIGAVVAQGFTALGADVAAVGLNADPGRSTTRLTTIELDVTDSGSVAAFTNSLDRLDVLITCAGIIRRDAEFDPDVFAEVLDVNLTGTMRAVHAARPLLRASGGSVVTTASMHSFISGPRVPAYTASKGGIAQLTKSLAAALGPEGVRVNAVAPGWVDTPLTAAIRHSAAGRSITERTPLGRWAEPAEVADAMLFLASPAARFITGTVLVVDGGFLTT